MSTNCQEPCDRNNDARNCRHDRSHYRIGYWLAEKKIRKLNFERFESMCQCAGMDIVKLNLDDLMDKQGPFDVILHKLTDQIARSEAGCSVAQKQIEQFKNYIAQNPDVIVIDPIENVMKLFDRHEQYSLVHECLLSLDKDEEFHCFIPDFIELTLPDPDENKKIIRSHGVNYPLVCKPTMSHGSSQSHQMSIVFNADGLQDVEIPCVAQTFINHNARLFKIFVVGDHNYIVERPSVKNLSAGGDMTIFFNSNDVSKPNSSSFLNQLVLPIREPDNARLQRLASEIRHKFDLDLLGIDVIIENTTGHYAIIDINTFPGYEDMSDFLCVLFNLVCDKLKFAEKKRTH